MLRKATQLPSSLMDPAQGDPAGERRLHGKGQRSNTGRQEVRGQAAPESGNNAMQRATQHLPRSTPKEYAPKMALTLECCLNRALQFSEDCK